MRTLKPAAALPAALLAALACAAAYVFVYGGVLQNAELPGFGMTLLAGTVLLAGLLLGWGRKKPDKQTVFLLLCAALLALCYSLFGSRTMRALNLPVLIALLTQGLLAFSGLNERPPLSPAGMREGALRFFSALGAHWGAPFSALAGLRQKRRLPGLWLGIFLAIPLLAVALLLLCSADAVFGTGFSGIAQSFQNLNFGLLIWQFGRLCVLTLLLFSALYTLSQPRREIAPAKARALPQITFGVPLAALCAVYALFVYVQFRYLFGGAETALLQGGYAQYARSGFFELVAVALLNLVVLSLCVSMCPPGRLLRALCALLTLLTAVILLSAAWRMRLYILAYGLSILRLLTLWAMAVIAAALLLMLCRLARPSLRIFPLLAALTLAGWIALNCVNTDRTIARYNIRAFEQGRLERLDAEYLCSLSPDVLPALREAPCYDEALRAYQTRGRTWFCMDLSDIRCLP